MQSIVICKESLGLKCDFWAISPKKSDLWPKSGWRWAFFMAASGAVHRWDGSLDGVALLWHQGDPSQPIAPVENHTFFVKLVSFA